VSNAARDRSVGVFSGKSFCAGSAVPRIHARDTAEFPMYQSCRGWGINE
jgi:hypothetical protein